MSDIGYISGRHRHSSRRDSIADSLEERGVGGRVLVLLAVAPDGSVRKARLASNPGVPALSQAALRVAKRMRFRLGCSNHGPVDAMLPMPLNFVPGG